MIQRLAIVGVNLWLFLVVGAAMILLAPRSTLAQTTTSAEADVEVDLYSLSDAELEEICTVRGFELVNEDDPSYVFTHDDYVEAARQCLAIESDMEDIIAEHPEILEELEEERDRMMAEKERLEQELAEATHSALRSGANHSVAEEEVVDLDQNETDFDVIGHQEPLSDTRVHEEPLPEMESESTPTSKEGSSVSEPPESNSHVEMLMEMREKFLRDLTLVADVVFPKAIRGPAKAILKTAGRVSKQLGMDLYEFVARHVKAMVDARKQQQQQSADDESANQDDDMMAAAAAASRD